MTDSTPTKFERTTLYVLPDHLSRIDELKIKLRNQGIRTNKSELVRTAIDLLAEQELERLIQRLAK